MQEASFEEIDTDKSGTIDMNEFLAWWQKHHGSKTASTASAFVDKRAVQNMNPRGCGPGGEEGGAAAEEAAAAVEEEQNVWHADVFALLSGESAMPRLARRDSENHARLRCHLHFVDVALVCLRPQRTCWASGC